MGLYYFVSQEFYFELRFLYDRQGRKENGAICPSGINRYCGSGAPPPPPRHRLVNGISAFVRHARNVGTPLPPRLPPSPAAAAAVVILQLHGSRENASWVIQ